MAQYWRSHRVRIAIVGLLGLMVLAVILAHAPFVRAAVLARLRNRIEAAGVRLDADRLSYNLLTLNASLDRVTLAAADSATPFLQADAVRVKLPWSALWGVLTVESIEVDRPRLVIVRGDDGSTNLPAFEGSAGGGPSTVGPVTIGRLLVRDLAVRYTDTSNRSALTASGVTLDLRATGGPRLAGTLTASRPIDLQRGDRRTTVDRLEGRLAFDGRTLNVESFDAHAPELGVHLDGHVDLLTGDPQAALRYEADVMVDRAAPWAGLGSPAPSGVLKLSGAVDGPLAAPTVTVNLAGDALVWPGLGALSLEGRGTVTSSTVNVESFHVTAAGGEADGEARVSLEAAGSSEVRTRWHDLNLGAVARAFPAVPVRLASLASGDAIFAWTGDAVIDGHGRAALTLRGPAAASRALALSGRLEAQLADRQWRVEATHEVAGALSMTASVGGRLEQDLGTSTVVGQARFEVASARDALARLAAAGQPIVGDEIASRLDAATALRVDVSGTVDEPRAAGTLELTDLRFDQVGPGTATATFDATRERLAVDSMHVEVGPDVLTGRGSVGWRRGTVTAEVTGNLPALGALSAWLPVQWQPRGAAAFTVRVGGVLGDPAVDTVLTAHGIRIAGQTVDALRAHVSIAAGVVTVEELAADQGDGHLSATGRYAATSGQYTVDLTATGLAVRPLLTGPPATGGSPAGAQWPIEARVDARLSGQGTLDMPQLGGTLQLSDVAWGDYRIGTVHAGLTIDGDEVRVRSDLPEARATIEAALGLSARTFTIDAALTNADLDGLVAPHGPAGPSQAPAGDAGRPEVQGTVTLSANLAGRLDDLAASTGAIDVGATDVVVQGLDVHMDRPAHLRYADGQLAAEDFELRAGSSTLSARGRLGTGVSPDDALRLDLTGSVADFLPLLRLAPNAGGVEASGTVDVHLRATGPLDAPDLTADVSLAGGSFASDAVPAISAITLTAAYHAGVFEVTEAHGTWQGAEATASGRLPIAMLGPIVPAAYLRSLPAVPGPAHADVRLTSVTPRALEPFLDQDTMSRLGGRIDVSATVDAEALDAKSVRADIVFDRADLELARVPIGQVAPTHLRLADGRLDVVHWSWAGAGNHLDVTGNVDLTGSAPRLALGVSGSLDLRMIGAVAPDVATVGRAVLDMKATGTLEDPTIEGHVSVDQTDIVIRNPRLAITDLQGTATFTRDHVQLDDVTANANGGTVEVAGAVDYRDFALTGGAITIRGRGLALAVADNLRTEVDADLTLSADANAPALTGRVTVVRGYYREPISLTEQLLTGSNTSSPVLEGAEPGPFDRVRLNIAVVSAEDLVVDNNYAKAEVGSNLRVAGTIGTPVLAGRLTVQEGGEVFLGGRTYTIQRGTVDFLDPTRIEPTIDLALETRVQQYDITLEVSGTPETLDVSLRSPGQSQEDVVSLLLTGQLAAQSTVAQTEIARGQLLMLLSGEFLGFAGRAVGLDSVQVGRGLGGAASDFDLLSTDTDPSARLTIARHLSRNVELVFSQSLRESGGSTWIVSYRPGRNVELRATTEDNNSRSYEFRHELVFGGPRRAGAEPARASGSENVRVSAVTFSGSPGATSDELRSRVRLKAGDRFDFYRWQQDRDRLTAWYHDRGYLEARVTARRTESPGPAAGVVLEYVIERGPRTVLTVTGVTLPGDVMARMKEAWGRAVFDGFLRDDLEQMAREALARDGYLRAEVTTTVQEPESGVKAIVLQVTPGQSFDRRELVFTGNARMPSDELRAVVEQQGLSVEAWLSPDTLQSALERYYRSRGYMAAVVTPGHPVFDAGTATLPVVIDEGPLFHIGRVLVQGATAWSDDRVRSTSGLVPGSAYQPAAVEPARRAVERAYLREGYNDVRVSATARVDRDQARVDVEFDLTEGPQQVLAGVDVTGATVTTPGTIDTAVDLAPGGPATLDKVYRAQKRLYDTGVFQSADVTLEPAEAAPPVSGVQPVRAVVTLRELPRYRFRYGFRLTDDVAPVEPTRQVRPALVADLLRRNLFGRAISTGVAGQIESNRRLARAVMSLPTLFGLPLVTNVFATTSRDYFAPQSEYESGRVERRNEFTLEQRFRPAATMLVSYGYSFGNKHTFDPKPDPTSPLPSLDLATNIARLTATYAWDTRDDPSNAHRGWFHSSGMEFGSAALGSELRFIRYLAQQDYFRQVGGSVVLASAFRLGAGHAFGGQTLTEKFYAGGGTSVRGFAEDALGGSDFFGAVGGNALVVLSQEVRFPIFRWVRGVGFIDAGNVFPTASDLSFLDLEAGTGAGLRVHSPFGVLRLDFGIPLTHREQQPRGRWYVGIGQTF